jgi:MINDY deubiquitinase
MSSVDTITFSTKIVNFRGGRKRIVLQNQNGPCPLLAIVNGLILQDKLQLPSGASDVDSSRLQHQLVGHIVDSQTNTTANLRHQIDETIQLVMRGRFVEGMDVNPKFSSCSAFEYTQEVCDSLAAILCQVYSLVLIKNIENLITLHCITPLHSYVAEAAPDRMQLAVFDLCGVQLLHGWIVDPDADPGMEKLYNMSYNSATLAVVGRLDEDSGLVEALRSSLSASARAQLAERYGTSEKTIWRTDCFMRLCCS